MNKKVNLVLEFTGYFNSFYGVEGLYSHGRNYTAEDMIYAMDELFKNKPKHRFDGDSMDRELIRDIMLESPVMLEYFKNKGPRL